MTRSHVSFGARLFPIGSLRRIGVAFFLRRPKALAYFRFLLLYRYKAKSSTKDTSRDLKEMLKHLIHDLRSRSKMLIVSISEESTPS